MGLFGEELAVIPRQKASSETCTLKAPLVPVTEVVEAKDEDEPLLYYAIWL